MAKTTKKTKRPATAGKKTTKSASASRSSRSDKKTTTKAQTAARKATSTRSDKRVRSTKPVGQRQEVPYTPPLPGTPGATEGKPRKNQAGLGKRDLDHFRTLLLDKRRELVGDMNSMEREALRSGGGSNLSNLPIHMADMGTDNYEQEFTLGLMEKDRVLLREINHALVKIQDGSYGICEATGKPISRARLEAQPWARHSIEYARQMEKGQIRRPAGL